MLGFFWPYRVWYVRAAQRLGEVSAVGRRHPRDAVGVEVGAGIASWQVSAVWASAATPPSYRDWEEGQSKSKKHKLLISGVWAAPGARETL